jgi:hypothetical protein
VARLGAWCGRQLAHTAWHLDDQPDPRMYQMLASKSTDQLLATNTRMHGFRIIRGLNLLLLS